MDVALAKTVRIVYLTKVPYWSGKTDFEAQLSNRKSLRIEGFLCDSVPLGS